MFYVPLVLVAGVIVALDQITKAVLFSPSECCRLVKRVTGETIFSYLQSYRLAQSAHLLRHSALSVSQIAYDTGFCGTSYFIEVFKAKFDVTPHRFRKMEQLQNREI